MNTMFKWGIIGPGRIAEMFAEAVQGIPDASIYAVASRSQNPKQLEQIYNAEKIYSSYEELAADSKVDAIYIATPHRFHHENAMLCMDAEKAVLCEKSFTVSAKEADELFRLSQSKRVFLMEALWTRFLPIYEQVRQWLDAGEIGDIRLVYSTLGFVAKRDFEDRLLNIELAGGTVLDLAVYNSGINQWVYQKSPQAIAAVGQIGETSVDETISVTYSYENGATAQFTCTFQVDPMRQVTITGTKGMIIIHPNFYEATQASLVKGKKSKTEIREFETNGFEYEIKASMRAIREGALDCPQMTQADTLANMRALDTIRQQIGMHYPFE